MKRSTGLALGAAAILGAAVVAVPVIADQRDGWHGRMGMMEDEDGMMGGRMGGHDMMEHMHGMMRGGMMGGGNRYALLNFDADKDGTLSAEELRAGMLGDLKTYDTNGDGTLSLDEFQALFAAHTRTMMVRGFQMLDEDGDGKVTELEVTTAADVMQEHMDRGEWSRRLPGMGPDGTDRPGPGNRMMDDN
jgi:Ca2+-binding EF-hand superfamily protein